MKMKRQVWTLMSLGIAGDFWMAGVATHSYRCTQLAPAHAAMRGLDSWNPDLIRMIHGYDAIVIWKGAHASKSLR